ncbi:hypothetical protein ACRALDRAFT_2034697 [Sodiomyces alcalophilus JCM 7366]|uniref:uncharacterized protein n=1 Tax=Sodiomyces alcalophilus JCM 7366 TaxID=591952 RepID=UPI0039B64246
MSAPICTPTSSHLAIGGLYLWAPSDVRTAATIINLGIDARGLMAIIYQEQARG